MRMGSDVSQPLENGKREIWRGQLKGKTFADEPCQLCLMIEGVKARNDSACAVPEQEYGQAWLAHFCQGHGRCRVALVVLKFFDKKARAIRLTAAAKVYGIDCHAAGGQLCGHPAVIAAV